MKTRNDKILSCIQPASQIGLEIGALDKPIVTREMGEVRYVDYASTEHLREKYAADPNVNTDKIVEVNYLWGSQSLPDLVGEAKFDYVIASHVIEHVPDFIGWLEEIRAILKPNGILSLAIPNKQFCFDYFRQTTKPADVIDAYLNHPRRPSPRQLFDHFSSVVFWQGRGAWNEQANEQELVRVHSDEQAWELARTSFEKQIYYDAHCWVFTPFTFFELLKTLIKLDLFRFKVAQYYETEGCEFHVSLKALNPELEVDDRQQIQLASLPQLEPEPQSQPTASPQLDQFSAQLQQTQALMETIAVQNQTERNQLKKRIKVLKARLAEATNEITAMETSKFWKLRSYWFKLKKQLRIG